MRSAPPAPVQSDIRELVPYVGADDDDDDWRPTLVADRSISFDVVPEMPMRPDEALSELVRAFEQRPSRAAAPTMLDALGRGEASANDSEPEAPAGEATDGAVEGVALRKQPAQPGGMRAAKAVSHAELLLARARTRFEDMQLSQRVAFIASCAALSAIVTALLAR